MKWLKFVKIEMPTLLPLERLIKQSFTNMELFRLITILNELINVTDLVEKPKKEDAPSNLAVTGSMYYLRRFLNI